MYKFKRLVNKHHRILAKIAKLQSMAYLLDSRISFLEKKYGWNRYD